MKLPLCFFDTIVKNYAPKKQPNSYFQICLLALIIHKQTIFQLTTKSLVSSIINMLSTQ